jgi:hypothetical protein
MTSLVTIELANTWRIDEANDQRLTFLHVEQK